MNRAFRFQLFLFFLATVYSVIVFSCGKSNSSPTQPVVLTPTSPPGATATPTIAAGATATPTRPAATATPTTLPAGMRTVNVGQGGLNFVDSQSGNSTTTIRAGDTVMWVWVGGVLHSTTSGMCCTPDGKWDSGLKTSGSFSRTFASSGNFPYYCTNHGAAMTGTVVVNP